MITLHLTLCGITREPIVLWGRGLKTKIHYTSFPVASPQQVRNINDKSVASWHGQKSVVSVVSCHFPNSITTTCCQLVGHVTNKSITSYQLPRLRRSYGEMCVRDFGH